ncbi:MAG: 1-phosphofructokinase family hexose kinase [Arthrobacter sp.]|nr:1-phosphofructokinase family hexose kinase [Arthrobacter sp.]
MNVFRVVQRLGCRTLAVYTAGGPTGEAYCRLVEAERVPTLAVPMPRWPGWRGCMLRAAWWTPPGRYCPKPSPKGFSW